ncbi:MAG TPA: sigma-54 dependent transcriptional regulator [Longimicrobiales bacterium]
MAVRILVLDLEANPCVAESCGRLAGSLRGLFPGGDVVVDRVRELPAGGATAAPDIVLLRPGGPGRIGDAVRSLHRNWAEVPILGVLCDSAEADAARLVVGRGLDDFLSCPFTARELMWRVQRLLQRRPAAGASESRSPAPIGVSSAFVRIIDRIPEVACCDATVLISGETGTGKEVVARAIHYRSPRRDKPFIPVNSAALPDHLLENELFGHARGAYTDAASSEKGLVAEAEGGSLLLDEVNALSRSAQAKLLRFLQDGEYRPLGSPRTRTGDVRIIAATNTDLRQQVRAGSFREDLFYRLNIIPLRLPPLRERIEDIPLLAQHFLDRFANGYARGPLRLSTGAVQRLLAYGWPGNVRELEAVIHRAVVLASASELGPEDLDLPAAPGDARPVQASFREAKARAIDNFERSYLVEVMAANDGNITRAARRAGKERRAFQRLLQKHGLNREAFRG